MSDPDRLAEIKARLYPMGDGVWREYAIWKMAADLILLIGEVERLRGRLKELEWMGVRDLIDEQRCCPVCAGRPTQGQDGEEPGHALDCWLAAEIRST